MFELASKTKRLLAMFEKAPYGAEFTYAQILQETECDLMEGDRQRIYTVVRRLERDHRRTLLNLRGRGYKVARPGEFVSAMRVRGGKARRQIVLASRTGNAAPLELLKDGESRDLADYQAFTSRVQAAFKVQTVWNEQQDERLRQIEQRLGITEAATVEGDAVEDDAA